MKKQLYITIPTPCHENWDNMTPAAKGRFCQACAKTVVDFTAMTDSEILHYFSKAAGNTCGRFANDQLQRPLQPLKDEKRKAWWIAAIMPLLMMFEKGKAQVRHTITRKVHSQQLINTSLNLIVPTVSNKPILLAQPVDSNILNERNKNDSLDIFALEKSLVGAVGVVQIYTAPAKIDTLPNIIRRVLHMEFFKIFPDPAHRGSFINIDLKKAGDYTIQLFDNSGKLVLIKPFIASKGPTQTQINLPATLATGTYYLRLIDEKTKKQYTDKIVVM
ncbi:MAG TPA: T9SS type A sorting domain-containing protein [Chitinophagaceae bacterium]|nr:T9SS type A sorting domain-containing protein [Chitinophagaceae bacterium]